MYDVTVQALREELEKISASKEQMKNRKQRQGHRSMHVETLLRKEKDGSLYKETKLASSLANSSPWVASGGINVTEPEKMGRYPSKKKQGDAPTLDDGTGNPKMDSSQTVSGVVPVTKTAMSLEDTLLRYGVPAASMAAGGFGGYQGGGEGNRVGGTVTGALAAVKHEFSNEEKKASVGSTVRRYGRAVVGKPSEADLLQGIDPKIFRYGPPGRHFDLSGHKMPGEPSCSGHPESNKEDWIKSKAREFFKKRDTALKVVGGSALGIGGLAAGAGIAKHLKDTKEKKASPDLPNQARMDGSPPAPDSNIGSAQKREERQAAHTEHGSTTMPASAFAQSIKISSMADELAKIAGDVSKEEATESLQRLRKMQKDRPTGGQMLRGAAVGGTLGPVSSLIGSAIKGKDFPKSKKELARHVAAAAISGSALGTAIPMVTRALNEHAEKEKLKSYLGTSDVGSTRSAVRKTLGVG